MYFRNRDYKDDSLFKTRLKKLMDRDGIKSARALATILFEKEMVYIKPKSDETENWKFKQDRIGAIEKKIQTHLNADTPDKVTGEYIEAYCKLFHCPPDYMFCRTVIQADDIEVRRICEVTGLSEIAVIRLVESMQSGASMQSSIWSELLSSNLFYSIPEDYLTMQGQFLSEVDKTTELVGKKWEKEKVPDEIDAGIDNQIDQLKEEIDSRRAAFYGILSKMSRDIANFFETKIQNGFEEYKAERVSNRIKRLERFYTDQGMLSPSTDTVNGTQPLSDVLKGKHH